MYICHFKGSFSFSVDGPSAIEACVDYYKWRCRWWWRLYYVFSKRRIVCFCSISWLYLIFSLKMFTWNILILVRCLQLFLLRAAGFLLPFYIMAWAISILQRRRQRQVSYGCKFFHFHGIQYNLRRNIVFVSYGNDSKILNNNRIFVVIQ